MECNAQGEKICIKAGNTFYQELFITDLDGDPVDLTGKTVYIAVKERNDVRWDDSDALIVSTIVVHIDPTAGQTAWQLTPAQSKVKPGIYKADVRVYTDATNILNTDSFPVEVVRVVTESTP